MKIPFCPKSNNLTLVIHDERGRRLVSNIQMDPFGEKRTIAISGSVYRIRIEAPETGVIDNYRWRFRMINPSVDPEGLRVLATGSPEFGKYILNSGRATICFIMPQERNSTFGEAFLGATLCGTQQDRSDFFTRLRNYRN